MENESQNSDVAKRLTERFRKLLDRAVLLDRLSRSLFWGLLLVGVWFLLTRRLVPDWNDAFPWLLLAAGMVILGVSFLRFSRARWSAEDAAIVADQTLGAQGLCLAMYEVPDPHWEPWLQTQSQNLEWPRPDWNRALSRLIFPFLFASLAALVPLAATDFARPHVGGGEIVERLQRKLEVMAEENLIAAERREDLEKEVKKLRKSVQRGEFSASEWEAADHLRKTFEGELSEAVKTMMNAARQSHLQERQSDRNEKPQELSPELTKALAALSASGLSIDLDALQEKFGDSEEMAAAMAKLRRALEEQLKDLKLAGWVDEELLKEFAKVAGGT